MHAGCASRAGMLTPKGCTTRKHRHGASAIAYTEECLFALLLKQSHVTSNAVAIGRLTGNRNSMGKPGAHLGAVGASRGVG